jgi:hypothetical protein
MILLIYSNKCIYHDDSTAAKKFVGNLSIIVHIIILAASNIIMIFVAVA